MGRQLPEVKGPVSGIIAAAWSSKTTLTPVTAVAPPASDMMIAFWPPGPTRSISRSSGKVCVMPLTERLTSVTLVPAPLITQFEG